jgi:TctA family transporter
MCIEAATAPMVEDIRATRAEGELIGWFFLVAPGAGAQLANVLSRGSHDTSLTVIISRLRGWDQPN